MKLSTPVRLSNITLKWKYADTYLSLNSYGAGQIANELAKRLFVPTSSPFDVARRSQRALENATLISRRSYQNEGFWRHLEILKLIVCSHLQQILENANRQLQILGKAFLSDPQLLFNLANANGDRQTPSESDAAQIDRFPNREREHRSKANQPKRKP